MYIKPELYQWVEKQVKNGKFRKFSHAVDVALEKLRDSEKKEMRLEWVKRWVCMGFYILNIVD